MKKKRQYYNAQFKAKIAILAIKGEQTTSQICSEHRIDASQITRWKKELLDGSSDIFTRKKDADLAEKENEINILYKQIGKLTIQNEFLREKLLP